MNTSSQGAAVGGGPQPGTAPTDLDEFRAYTRSWAKANLEERSEAPPSLGSTSDDELRARVAAHRAIQARLFAAGLAGIRYPAEYGGQGLSAAHQAVFIDETGPYQMPTQLSVTLGILGPTVLDYGTEEQKRRYISGMLSGRGIWVQLLSEPSGGSDMAGARTRAVRDGDTYIVSGSKIWTTGAHVADFGLLLARTNPDATKHHGLSMIVTPLDTPGVTISPIQLATGTSDFCQEFLDDVRLPAANLLGPENEGWSVASRLLYHERQMVGGIGLSDTRNHPAPQAGESYEVIAQARQAGMLGDAATRQLIGEWLTLELLYPLAAQRISAQLQLGQLPPPGAALLKLLGGEIPYRKADLSMRVAGLSAGVWSAAEDGLPGEARQPDPAGLAWLVARTSTIAGGTNEMQLNQISERVLGLPREATPDRDVPFAQIRQTGR
jgi:alkylation response protein AidB-like acyl-CoA dehydrogenase